MPARQSMLKPRYQSKVSQSDQLIRPVQEAVFTTTVGPLWTVLEIILWRRTAAAEKQPSRRFANFRWGIL
jgi:hypothetical protein